MERSRRWTRQRFEARTQQFLPALHRAASRLTLHRADAEDLVHDTYVRAFEAFPEADLRSDAACYAWLRKIMVNLFRDRYRRRARSPEVDTRRGEEEGKTDPLENAASPEPGPESLLAQKRFAEAAAEAIAALPPDIRLVVSLFFFEDLSYKSIAESAGIPVGTVMSRLFRGRRLLQERLQDFLGAAEGPQESASSGRRSKIGRG